MLLIDGKRTTVPAIYRALPHISRLEIDRRIAAGADTLAQLSKPNRRNAGRAWTTADHRIALGNPARVAARLLGRSVNAVYQYRKRACNET